MDRGRADNGWRHPLSPVQDTTRLRSEETACRSKTGSRTIRRRMTSHSSRRTTSSSFSEGDPNVEQCANYPHGRGPALGLQRPRHPTRSGGPAPTSAFLFTPPRPAGPLASSRGATATTTPARRTGFASPQLPPGACPANSPTTAPTACPARMRSGAFTRRTRPIPHSSAEAVVVAANHSESVNSFPRHRPDRERCRRSGPCGYW